MKINVKKTKVVCTSKDRNPKVNICTEKQMQNSSDIWVVWYRKMVIAYKKGCYGQKEIIYK